MNKLSDQSRQTDIELSIPLKSVCYIIEMAREFDVKDADSELSEGSNATDDNENAVLEDRGDDPVMEELLSVISDLNEDEQIELVALMWLGREDNTAADWTPLLEQARDAHNQRTGAYLLGSPLLSDYLEEGLATIGYSCSELDEG